MASQFSRSVIQKIPLYGVSNVVAPTFAGISGAVAQADGSVLVSWAAATGAFLSPARYRIYISLGSVSAATLFASSNAIITNFNSLSCRVYTDSSGNQLTAGATYTFGVRAVSASNISENNSVILTSAITYNLYSLLQATPAAVWDITRTAHATAGTFGESLTAKVDVDVSTRAATADSRFANLDATVSSRATQTTANTINAKLGTPVTDVSADIASVKSDSSGIKTQTDKFSFDGSNYVNSRTKVNDDKTGYTTTPTNVTSIADAVWDADRASHVAAGSFGEASQGVISTTRANNLDNLDATITSRASQSSVNAIQNNTDFVGIVPPVLLLPETGSKTYPLYVRLFDDAGSPADADSNLIDITIKDSAGSVIVASTAMTRTAAGQYEYDYTVNDTDTEQALFVFFDYDKNGISFNQVRSTEVQEFESKLDALLSLLTPTRAANLDNLDTTVSSRSTQSTANTINTKIGTPVTDVSTDIAAVKADTHSVDVKVDVTLSTRASQSSVNAIPINPLLTNDSRLNNLDATVSSRATQSSVDDLDTKLGTPVISVSADIAAVKSDTGDLESKIGTPAVSVSADIAAVKTDIAAVKTETHSLDAKVDVSVSTRASQASVDAVPTAAENADAVWDENVNDHTTGTTTARTLKDAKIFSQIDL